MPKAIDTYSAAKSSPEAWMVARFVIPVARLDEFEESAPAHITDWTLSALAGGNLETELARIKQFNDRNRGRFVIDTIEIKANDVAEVESKSRMIPERLTVYLEVASAELVKAVNDVGARAKIRTGGITPEMFPPAAQIAALIDACAQTGTAFKATAGLHHPLRCHRPLTYSADGPSGWMYGFLNILASAIFAQSGGRAKELEPLLLAETSGALRLDEIEPDEAAGMRRDFFMSIGSCSLDEPVTDLKALHLL